MSTDSDPRPIPIPTMGECLVWFTAGLAATQLPWLALPVSLAILLRLLTTGAAGALMIFVAAQPIVLTIDLKLVPVPSVLACTALLSSALVLPAVIRRPRASRVLPWLIPWSALVVGLAWLRLSPDPTGVLVSRLALLAIQVVSGSLLVGHLAAHRLDPRTIIVAASLVAAGAMTHTGALYIPLFTRPDHAPLQDIGRAACAGATVLGGVTLYRWRGGATWLLVGLTALACIAGTATLSRQGIWSFLLAMCAVLPLVLLHRPVRRAKLLWLALGPLIVLIMAVVVAMLDPEQAQQLARLRFTQNPLAAFDTRRDVYLTAWRMFTERPLLGWGFGGFGPRVGAPALYPHNVVLEILAEFGLLGLVLWLAPLGLGFAARDHAAHTTDSYDDALHRTTLLALVVYWFGISSSSYSLPHGSFLFPALCWLPPALVRRDRLRAVGEETAGGADDA